MSEPLLNMMNCPEDLKKLTIEELNQLAAEIRSRIIDVMSVNGGHLASNLGAVELTIALHMAFESPKDKFIWDVSHQTYVHKLLTGRQELFPKIRQFKGLCGFSHPKESEHDHFFAGHAGTALSLALGVAKNRDLSKKDHYVVPIIGDATLTCGVSLEALNNIDSELKQFVVVLNDNAMSISQNVGAITHILSRMLSNPVTHKLHQELEAIFSKIPNYGSLLSKQGRRFTGSLKNLVSPAVFFQHYGLSYIGPIDGHDIQKLLDVFEGIKSSKRPVVIHVLTNKGQGMEEAIKNPVSYHGARPFNKDTGKFLPVLSNKPTFPKLFGSHLLKMAKIDSSIVAVTPAMLAGSCLDEFATLFPERCLDVGIAESHSVTFCGGLAYGKNIKVIIAIYGTFLQRAFDNLFHDVCLQQLPVVFAIDRAGISGPDGSTHHGVYDISFLNAMPNMIITQPRNGQILKELLESAFQWGRPVAIRYPNMATEDYEGPLEYKALGKGQVLIEGEDLLIVALGHMNNIALQAQELLLKYGIKATVMDPIFIKPLDMKLIDKLLETHHRLVTIEEHSAVSGLGSILNHQLMTNGYSNIQVLNCGIPETFVDHGSYGELMNELGLTSEKIVQRILHHFVWDRPLSEALNEESLKSHL